MTRSRSTASCAPTCARRWITCAGRVTRARRARTAVLGRPRSRRALGALCARGARPRARVGRVRRRQVLRRHQQRHGRAAHRVDRGGRRPGQHVIVPAFTFVATALAVLHPARCRSSSTSSRRPGDSTPKLVERAITPQTKAMMPVHMHGTPCDIDPSSRSAKRRGLLLDRGCRAGPRLDPSRAQGRYVRRARLLSLQSQKSMPAAKAASSSPTPRTVRARNRAADVRRGHPAERRVHYRIERALDGNRAYDSLGMGWMYRMNEMSAAIARAQLAKLDEFNATAQRNAAATRRRGWRSCPA